MTFNTSLKNLRWMIMLTVLLVFVGSMWLSRSADAMTGEWNTNTSTNDIYNTNSGKVGIGTSTPSSQLSIVSTDSTNGQFNAAYDSTHYVKLSHNGDQTATLTVSARLAGSTPAFVVDTTTATGVGYYYPFEVRAQGTKVFNVDSSGSVAMVGTLTSNTLTSAFNNTLNLNGGLSSTDAGVAVSVNDGGTGNNQRSVFRVVTGGTNVFQVLGLGSGLFTVRDATAPVLLSQGATSQTGSYYTAIDSTSKKTLEVQPVSSTNSRAQLFLYNTLENTPTNYERLAMYADNVNNIFRIDAQNAGSGTLRNIELQGNGGNVGIGTSNPTSKLYVTGDITASGRINATYQDVAEWVPTSQTLSTGTVVILDSSKRNNVIASSKSYDTRVAGVVSERPGVLLGESGAGKAIIATTGRVMIKVDATHKAIEAGDLLVTSDLSGYAMRSEPVNFGGIEMHRPGTLIGKALEPLAKGKKGEILVLLSLQ